MWPRNLEKSVAATIRVRGRDVFALPFGACAQISMRQFTRSDSMKLSARNQIPGTITSVKPGATTTHVTIAIAGDVTVTASITNEASAELALKPGMEAFAVIKASDVMVGV